MNIECRICGNNSNNETFNIREMMYGSREEFQYFECSNCKCIQILNIPEDLSKYYHEGYYAFSKARNSSLKNFFKKKRLLQLLEKKSLLGNITTRIWGPPIGMEWLKNISLKVSDKILDVGSGEGHLLSDMYLLGFTQLTGLDPYIKEDIVVNSAINVFKKTAREMEGEYDFVMMHHTFEHLVNPLEILKDINKLLKKGHYLLIRTPVADCYAWHHYKTNWVQLDPPRHICICSAKGIRMLAQQAGFEITNILYDSFSFQFWGSELYVKDKPLMELGLKGSKSLFPKKEINKYERFAKALNIKKEGDQACFYLKKI